MPWDGCLCDSCNVIRSISRALEESNNRAWFHKIMGNRKVVKTKIKINPKFGRKMYVNGFVLMGIGMGSLVFGFFSYNFLNPDRLAPIDGLYQGSP